MNDLIKPKMNLVNAKTGQPIRVRLRNQTQQKEKEELNLDVLPLFFFNADPLPHADLDEAYRMVARLSIDERHAETLYNWHGQMLGNYLQEHFFPTHFASLEEQWIQYNRRCQQWNAIFSFLDRFYTRYFDKPEIEEASQLVFFQTVFQPLAKTVIDTLLCEKTTHLVNQYPMLIESMLRLAEMTSFSFMDIWKDILSQYPYRAFFTHLQPAIDRFTLYFGQPKICLSTALTILFETYPTDIVAAFQNHKKEELTLLFQERTFLLAPFRLFLQSHLQFHHWKQIAEACIHVYDIIDKEKDHEFMQVFFLSLRDILPKTKSPIESFIPFIDEWIKGGQKAVCLEPLLLLAKAITDQEYFQLLYCEHARKRYLRQSSFSQDMIEFDRQLILQWKPSSSRLEPIWNDVVATTCNIKTDIVEVTRYWNQFSFQSSFVIEKRTDVLPESLWHPMQKIIFHYKEQYPYRKLFFAMDCGQMQIAFRNDRKTRFLLHMLPIQAMILFAYLDTDILSFGQLMDILQCSALWITLLLEPFLQLKLLIQDEIDKSKYKINLQFTSIQKHIFIPAKYLQEKREEEQEEQEEHNVVLAKQFQMDAVIMRIMKSAKEMPRESLLSLTSTSTSSMSMISQRIDILIAKDYLFQNHKSIISYVP